MVEKLKGILHVPNSDKRLQACQKCKFILTEGQWKDPGYRSCPNCGSDKEKTSEFHGMISMIILNHSWVGKWNRLEAKIPGVYASKIIGKEE